MKRFRLSLRNKLLALIVAMLFATAVPLVLTALDFLWNKEVETAESRVQETLSILAYASEESLSKSIFMKATAMEEAKESLKNTAHGVEKILRQELQTQSPKDLIAHLNLDGLTTFCLVLRDGSILGSSQGLPMQDSLGIPLADIAKNHLALRMGDFYVFKKEQLYLAYFTPMPEWDMLLACSLPLDAIRELTQRNIAAIHNELERFVYSQGIQDKIDFDILYRNDKGGLYSNSERLGPERLHHVEDAVRQGKTYVEIRLPQGNESCYIRQVQGHGVVIVAISQQKAFLETVFPLFIMHCAMFGLLILLAMVATSWLAMRLFSPLKQLTRLATILPTQDYTKPVNLNVQLPVERHDEIGDLARSLSQFTDLLHKNVSQTVHMTALKEAMAHELAIASEIQKGFLPSNDARLENHPGFAIASRILPQKEIGGDLYDYFLLDEDTLCIAIGDVSGHGVPAALLMSQCLTLLRGRAEHSSEAERVVENANRILSAHNPQNMFVSLLFGCYSISTGILSFCLAGHPPPILMQPDSASCGPLQGIAPDLVVGLMPDVPYARHTVLLKPGETLFLYTDGISEAVDSKGAFFGEQGILQALNHCLAQPVEEIADRVLAEVARFTEGAEPNDDRTMLVLQRKV